MLYAIQQAMAMAIDWFMEAVSQSGFYYMPCTYNIAASQIAKHFIHTYPQALLLPICSVSCEYLFAL